MDSVIVMRVVREPSLHCEWLRALPGDWSPRRSDAIPIAAQDATPLQAGDPHVHLFPYHPAPAPVDPVALMEARGLW